MSVSSEVVPESEHRPGARLIEWFARFLLGFLAAVLLWAGRHQAAIWQNNLVNTNRLGFPRWLAWVGLVVLAGLVLRLAAGPRRHWRYRVSTALAVGIIPFLMLLQVALFYFVVVQHHVELPLISKGWFYQHTTWYTDIWSSWFAVAVMLGVAISAGFRTRETVTGERL